MNITKASVSPTQKRWFNGLPHLLLLMLWLIPVLVQAQFNYETNNGTITITGYTGSGGDVVIPDFINGLPVTSIGYAAFRSNSTLTTMTFPDGVISIGNWAFHYCTNLTSVSIPKSVTSIGIAAFDVCSGLRTISIPDGVTNIWNGAFGSCSGLTDVKIGNSVVSIGNLAFTSCRNLTNVTIGNRVAVIGIAVFNQCSRLSRVTFPNSLTIVADGAFANCTNLTGVFFLGDAPAVGSSVFESASPTNYYLPGTFGWGPAFGGRPTAPWSLPSPRILNHGAGFGVQTNAFGFRVSWATNIPVVVEACTNLAAPDWSPLATNMLSGGWFYFSDPEWTNYPSRLYRVRSQ